jgi:hypothetical protein
MEFIVVYNDCSKDIKVFSCIDAYTEHAMKNNGHYDIWADEVYAAREGQNIFESQPMDLTRFKDSL